MANLDLKFEIEGDVALNRSLEGVSADFKNWQPEFRKTGDMLIKTFRMNFVHKGALLGEEWQALNAKYLQWKQKNGYSPNILVKTGRMMKSFKQRASPYDVEIWNTADYFAFHQSNKPRSRLPRRVMMKLTFKLRQDIVRIFQTAVQSKLQERGL